MKSSADPTGQQRPRKKALRALTIRLTNANRRINQIIRGLSVNLAVTEYNISAQDLELLHISVERIINEELLESQNQMPPQWYFKDEIEQPYRAGTAEEINDTNRAIQAGAIAGLFLRRTISPRQLTVQEVLFSPAYQSALNKVNVKNYGVIKGLSKGAADGVINVVNNGINSGLSRRAITQEINTRFDVSKSRAKRIVNTEVNRAYNDARIDAAIIIENETRVKTKVRHISALLPTTRSTHAARHQKTYTREEQQRWWDSGVNRINCYCTIQTVIEEK